MKRFMFASIGLLCLSLSALVGFHVGSKTVHAKATEIPGVVHVDGSKVLDINGVTWIVSDSWEENQGIDPPPVPLEDIVHWSPYAFMTTQGDMWIHGAEWDNRGPWPGSPVPTDNSSWGAIKGKYKEGD